MHVKTGDKVKVITGKDKGKEGVILKTFPKKDRVIVEGINIVKKHRKASQTNPTGGILEEAEKFSDSIPDNHASHLSALSLHFQKIFFTLGKNNF